MRRRLFISIFFTLQGYLTSSQDLVDTVTSVYMYNYPWHSFTAKKFYKYDEKGKKLSEESTKGNKYDGKVGPGELITYSYTSFDSLESRRDYEWDSSAWKPKMYWKYQYNGQRLERETHVSRSILSKGILYFNDWKTVETISAGVVPGKKLNNADPDVYASITTYQYDGQNRLVKQASYSVTFDTSPREIWLWLYDRPRSELLNEETEINNTTIHTQTYKGSLLLSAIDEKYESPHDRFGMITIDKDLFSYSSGGKLETEVKSYQLLFKNKSGKDWKKEKEQVYEKRYFEFKDNKLVKEKVESRSSETITKVSIWDRMAAYHSDSHSTWIGSQKTTYVTSWTDPVAPTTKTRHKWESYEINYEYDAAGNLVKKDNNKAPTCSSCSYDAKGRLVHYEYTGYEDISDFEKERPLVLVSIRYKK